MEFITCDKPCAGVIIKVRATLHMTTSTPASANITGARSNIRGDLAPVINDLAQMRAP